MSRSADLSWLCCGPTRSTFLPTPSAGARSHQHRGRLAAQPSRCLSHRVQIPWRTSRALFALWRFGRSPTEHALRSSDLAWLCCGPTRSKFLSTLPAGARPRQHRCRLTARPSRGSGHRVQIPWRTSRVLLALWRFGRSPTEHALRSSDLAWLCCGPTRSKFLPTLSAGARPHQHRGRLAARPSRGLSHRVQIPWRVSRALFALWRIGRQTSEHCAVRIWRGCGVDQRAAF